MEWEIVESGQPSPATAAATGEAGEVSPSEVSDAEWLSAFYHSDGGVTLADGRRVRMVRRPAERVFMYSAPSEKSGSVVFTLGQEIRGAIEAHILERNGLGMERHECGGYLLAKPNRPDVVVRAIEATAASGPGLDAVSAAARGAGRASRPCRRRALAPASALVAAASDSELRGQGRTLGRLPGEFVVRNAPGQCWLELIVTNSYWAEHMHYARGQGWNMALDGWAFRPRGRSLGLKGEPAILDEAA